MRMLDKLMTFFKSSDLVIKSDFNAYDDGTYGLQIYFTSKDVNKIYEKLSLGIVSEVKKNNC
jgi:hypothetical protein